MTKGPTPRQLARAHTTQRIKSLALTQLAESGVGSLSLRAIARELNLVSSAVYRYYSSRDDLLTALIIDAYNDLADRLEEADRGPRRAARRRFVDTCLALRSWAIVEPHRFGLIYGTTVPGYAAPHDTIEPAGRVVRALCRPAAEAAPTSSDAGANLIGRRLARQLDTTSGALELDVDRSLMLALVAMFSRIVGALTLELNGQFVGGFEPADDLFSALVELEADSLAL